MDPALKRVLYKRLLRQGFRFMTQKSIKERQVGEYLFQATRKEFRKNASEDDLLKQQKLFDRGVRTLALVNNAVLNVNTDVNGSTEDSAVAVKTEFDLLHQMSTIWYKNSHKKKGRSQEATWNTEVQSFVRSVNDELDISLSFDFDDLTPVNRVNKG